MSYTSTNCNSSICKSILICEKIRCTGREEIGRMRIVFCSKLVFSTNLFFKKNACSLKKKKVVLYYKILRPEQSDSRLTFPTPNLSYALCCTENRTNSTSVANPRFGVIIVFASEKLEYPKSNWQEAYCRYVTRNNKK